MLVVKWDPNTKTYSSPMEIDYCSLLSEDWDKPVECPCCHKKHKWGEMINCGNFYTVGGVWLVPVCPECADEIWKAQDERRKNSQM